MPSWEETKREGQMAFLSQGDNIQAAHESVDSFYRQILTRGYIAPSMENSDLTRQIADPMYEPTPEDWKEYERYLDEYPLPEPGDMEPER
ncbi:hypothetical protein [Thermogemmatispora carboxidivorans]|uniref:hypothetical protein n=1 Tax=Thermogemmatispora carboxidivorans TaxID=1382306 RepID=UPI00069A16E1|nr:hypothetical protein [Thermogemmatispora carboxidivorans]